MQDLAGFVIHVAMCVVGVVLCVAIAVLCMVVVVLDVVVCACGFVCACSHASVCVCASHNKTQNGSHLPAQICQNQPSTYRSAALFMFSSRIKGVPENIS